MGIYIIMQSNAYYNQSTIISYRPAVYILQPLNERSAQASLHYYRWYRCTGTLSFELQPRNRYLSITWHSHHLLMRIRPSLSHSNSLSIPVNKNSLSVRVVYSFYIHDLVPVYLHTRFGTGIYMHLKNSVKLRKKLKTSKWTDT